MKEHSQKVAFAIAAGVILLGSCLTGNQALAYAPEGDLMKIKGYSPEVIDTANSQRSRQEWREPSAPKQTPMEKFFHNIYYGNWTGGVDDFGSQVIREH